MNTDLLSNEYEVSDSPGLETFDPRLEEITTLVQNGAIDDAAPMVENVLEDGILDIRIVGYYCFMVFSDLGLVALADLFTGLAETLGDKWDAVGPASNREKITQNSINWFYKMLLKRLQREEDAQGPSWELWTGTVTSDDVGEMLDAAEELQQTIVATLEDDAGAIVDNLSKVSEWLRAFQAVVYQEPEEEPEEEPEDQEPEDQEPAAPTEETGLSVKGSYHLELLVRRMRAFEHLLEEEKYPRAALVADDINNTIANFDPTLYFPKLFSNFTRLLALNMSELAEYEEARDTRDWQAMQAFYHVDLDGFMDL